MSDQPTSEAFVFISYAHADLGRVTRLVDALQELQEIRSSAGYL